MRTNALCASGLSGALCFTLIGSCFGPKDCYLETSRNTAGWGSGGLGCQEKTEIVPSAHHRNKR